MLKLSDSFFWWDDAGQYWMSQGQAHGSAFLTAPGNLWTGVEAGRQGSNLDPIGFTILLRGWIEVFGTSATALRSLPFLFFVLSMVVGLVIGRKVFRLPLTLSLAIPVLVLFSSIPLYYATELRAYSIELFSVIAIAGLTLSFLKNRSQLIFAILMTVGLLSIVFTRYSVIIAIAASCTTILVASISKRGDGWWRIRILTVVFGGLALLFIAWNSGIISDADQPAPTYYTGNMDLQNSWNIDFLKTVMALNFVREVNIFTGAFIFVGVLALAVLALRRVGGTRFKDEAFRTTVNSNDLWLNSLVFVVSYEVFAAILSALGLTPWWSAGRWSIGLYGIAMISAFALFKLTFDVYFGWRTASPDYPKSQALLIWLLILFTLLTSVYAVRYVLSTSRDSFRSAAQSSFASSIFKATESATHAFNTEWFVSTQIWPSFRMVWETQTRDQTSAPTPITAANFGLGFSYTAEEEAQAISDQIQCRQGVSQFVILQGVVDLQLEALKQVAEMGGCDFKVIDESSGTIVRIE
jgi:uncharacterized membrane protein